MTLFAYYITGDPQPHFTEAEHIGRAATTAHGVGGSAVHQVRPADRAEVERQESILRAAYGDQS